MTPQMTVTLPPNFAKNILRNEKAACAEALTQAAFHLRATMKKEIKDSIKNPIPRTENAQLFKVDQKALTVDFFLNDNAAKRGVSPAKYLSPLIYGTARVSKAMEGYFGGKYFLIPSPKTQLDAFGNIPGRQVTRMLSDLKAFGEVGSTMNAKGGKRGVKKQKKKDKAAGVSADDSADVAALKSEVADLKGQLSASEKDVSLLSEQIETLETEAEVLKKKATPRDKIIRGLEDKLKDAQAFYESRMQEMAMSVTLQNAALASAISDRDLARSDSKIYLTQRNEMEAEVGVWQKRATWTISGLFTAAVVGFGASQIGITLPMAISGAKQNILWAFTYPAVILGLAAYGALSKMKSTNLAGGKKVAAAALGALQVVMIGNGAIGLAHYGVNAHARALEQSRCPEGGCIFPKPPEQDCKVDFSESVEDGRRVAKITMPSNDRCYSVINGNSYSYVIAGPPLPVPAK